MYTKTRPKALGAVGLDTEQLGESKSRVTQWDASGEIGENHGIENYLRSNEVTTRLRHFLFGHEEQGE